MIKKIYNISILFLFFSFFKNEIIIKPKTNIIENCKKEYLFSELSIYDINHDEKISDFSALECLQIAGYFDNKFNTFLIKTLKYKKNNEYFITKKLIDTETETNIRNLKELIEIKKNDKVYINWIFEILLSKANNNFLDVFDDFYKKNQKSINENLLGIRNKLNYNPYKEKYTSGLHNKDDKTLKDDDINKILLTECKDRVLKPTEFYTNPNRPYFSFKSCLEILYLGDKENSYSLFKEAIFSNLEKEEKIELIHAISKYKKKDDYAFFQKLFYEISEKTIKQKLLYSMDGLDDENYSFFLKKLQKENILEKNEIDYLIEKINKRIFEKNIKSFEDVLNNNPDIVMTNNSDNNINNLIMLNERYNKDFFILGLKYLMKKFPEKGYLKAYIVIEILNFNETAIKVHMKEIRNDTYLTSKYLEKSAERELNKFNYKESLHYYKKISENNMYQNIDRNSIKTIIEKLKTIIKFNGV
ncbi:hypothetical protein CLV96_3973 [Leptospira meyeri]|uniref:Uncharacterized protein n=1 Tax=Leptospira meyeri TaxID=29508 RepID=A0A4R8MPB9_LEPME|nr:hypothetical protein [Leptospira meyeri]TDY66256.1 hypothetical protein CLV96_3973 [Leptospira meyeri]